MNSFIEQSVYYMLYYTYVFQHGCSRCGNAFILYPFKKKIVCARQKLLGKNNRENAAKLNEIDKKTVVLVAVGGRARTASDKISQATHEC